MNFHNGDTRKRGKRAAFTLIEVIMAISMIGLGVATTIGALTKINAIAAMSRNATGAFTVANNQIDLILSDGPFNPQNKNDDGSAAPQVPAVLALGTHAPQSVAIYKDPQNGVVVPGTMETTVANISSGSLTMYRATVIVAWQYLGRGPIWSATRNRWEYQVSLSTVRASDK